MYKILLCLVLCAFVGHGHNACKCTVSSSVVLRYKDVEYTQCSTPNVAALVLQALKIIHACTLASILDPVQLFFACSVWSCDIKMHAWRTCSLTPFPILQVWKSHIILVSNKTRSSGQSETFLIMINIPKHDQHAHTYVHEYICENRFFIQSLMLLHSANIKYL